MGEQRKTITFQTLSQNIRSIKNCIPNRYTPQDNGDNIITEKMADRSKYRPMANQMSSLALAKDGNKEHLPNISWDRLSGLMKEMHCQGKNYDFFLDLICV